MLPLITASITASGYTIGVEPNKGYRYVMYSSGGKEPQYDNTYPFTLKIYRTINGYQEDVTNTPNATYRLNYTWSAKGRIYKSSGWVNSNNLTIENNSDTYYKNFKPSDTFDGECVTNAVFVQLSLGGTEFCKIHIPVHFYLNKYGIAALND